MSAETFAVARPLSIRGLRLARAAWLLMLVIGLTLAALELPIQYRQYMTVCFSATCAGLQLSPAQAAELPRLGLSLPAVAVLFTALGLFQVLAFVSMGASSFGAAGPIGRR